MGKPYKRERLAKRLARVLYNTADWALLSSKEQDVVRDLAGEALWFIDREEQTSA
jgi:hypothetical protein